MHTAAFLRNIIFYISLFNYIISYKALFNKKLSVKYLYLFNQSIYVYISAEIKKVGIKLLYKIKREIIVDYGKLSKIYRVYIPNRHVIVEN